LAEVKEGYLLISDISGYTQFLVESELAHAKEILDTLLATTIDAIKAPIRMLNTRGDAVVAFVAANEFLQPQSLLEAVERIYFDFRRQLTFMNLNTTCTCNACINMGALDLKVFLHYGEYIEQDINGMTELQGADVILANLLMKNGVKELLGLDGYALITDVAIEAMAAEALTTGMTIHTEGYEHFGETKMRIWDLPAAWERERMKRRAAISPETAWIVESVDTSAPQWTAWDHATDAGKKEVYYDMISVDRVDDLGGPVREGSQYHCVHDQFDVRFTITDWNPPHHFQSKENVNGIGIEFTMQIVATEGGSTLRIMYGEPEAGDLRELEPLFRGAALGALRRLVGLLENDDEISG
jgi:hypothetical protein